MQAGTTHVLNVVGEVLWVAEGALDALDQETRGAVVLESDEQFDHLSSRQIGAFRFNKQDIGFDKWRRRDRILILSLYVRHKYKQSSKLVSQSNDQHSRVNLQLEHPLCQLAPRSQQYRHQCHLLQQTTGTI